MSCWKLSCRGLPACRLMLCFAGAACLLESNDSAELNLSFGYRCMLQLQIQFTYVPLQLVLRLICDVRTAGYSSGYNSGYYYGDPGPASYSPVYNSYSSTPYYSNPGSYGYDTNNNNSALSAVSHHNASSIHEPNSLHCVQLPCCCWCI